MIYCIKYLTITLMLLLTACVDLTGTHSTYKAEALAQEQTKQCPRGEVHTMRGGLGVFSIGMNLLKESTEKEYHIPAYTTMWYRAGDVTRFITKRYYQQKDPSPIILIGHSLGANEQIKVARNLNKLGIPVALLVTVDAVSQTIIPPNVAKALNIYKPGYVPMFSGLKLRAVDPKKTIIENINVNDLTIGPKVNHFTVDKNKEVQTIILKRINQVIRARCS